MNSIKDIALEAGVSTGTVDRVIHNRKGVSEKTRIKVQKIIDSTNFTINPVASSLASKKEYLIASLIPKTDSSSFWNFPKQGILHAIDSAKNYGIRIHEFEFDQFSTTSYQIAFKELVACKPNAVLIAPIFLKETKKLVKQLETKNIPYIFINVEIEGLKNLSFIGQKSFESGFLSGKMLHLISPSKADFLIINFRKNIENYNASMKRIAGFRSFFSSFNHKANVAKISIGSNQNITEITSILKAHFSKNNHSHGIFVPSSKVNIIAKCLEQLNQKNVKLIGFDTTPENISYIKKDIIHFLISQKPYKQGYNGIQILVNYLIHNSIPKKNYFSPIELITKENVDFMNQ